MLDHKDYFLNGGADHRIQLGALCEIGLVITNIGTAVVLYPIARRHSETLSLSWVASRIVESTVIAVGAVALLAVVTLRQDGGGDAGALLVQGRSLVAVHDWTFLFGPGFCVGVGYGIILGYLMWKTQHPAAARARRPHLILFDVVDTGGAATILVVPEIFWEAALGFYTLIKGFRVPPAPAAADWQLRPGAAPATVTG